MSSFISQHLTEIEAVTGCTLACICHTVFHMISCLQINWQPFYLCQLLKFHPFEWLIKIYLQTEGQGTPHKMVSLQPMPGFSPLFLMTPSSMPTALMASLMELNVVGSMSSEETTNAFLPAFSGLKLSILGGPFK